MRTNDGGRSWTSRTVAERLNAVSAPDASHAWAVSENGTIYAIEVRSDGGTSVVEQDWVKWDGPGLWRLSPSLMSVDFDRDALHGWAVGYVGRSDGWSTWRTFVFLKTEDGGKHWTQMQPSGWDSWGRFAAVDCVDAEHAWVVMDGMVWSTADSGSTWRWVVTSDITGAPQSTVLSVHFENAMHGWLAGAVHGGAVWVTEDGGASWHQQVDNLAVSYLKSVSFGDATQGFAVGTQQPRIGDSGLWATSDGGANWIMQAYPDPSYDVACTLMSVSSPDSSHAYAVGYSGASGSGRLLIYGPDEGPPGSLHQPYRPLTVTPEAVTTVVLIGGLWSGYGDEGDGAGQTWEGVAADLRKRHYDLLIPPMKQGWPPFGVTESDVMDSMGGIDQNVARLDKWLAEQTTLTSDSRLILVGHSMGGLIARRFAESDFQRTSKGKVVGIYQIDTPNRGSPLAAFNYLWHLPGLTFWSPLELLKSQAVEDLIAGGDYITKLNKSVAARTTVPTRRVGSNFFSIGNAAEAGLSLQKVAMAANLAAFSYSSNDGLVTVSSAHYAPPGSGSAEGSVTVSAIHGPGITGLAQLWPDADVLPPKAGTTTASTIFPDLSRFISSSTGTDATSTAFSASVGANVVRELGRRAAAAPRRASPLPADLDSAAGWKTCAELVLRLSSEATASVPFSVEATAALVSVAAQAGTPTLSVVDASGAPLACHEASQAGVSLAAFECAPGRYAAEVGLLGADTGDASVMVSDLGPSELRVASAVQASTGTAFVVEAGVYEAGVRQVGAAAVTAALGGASVILRDDGLGADAAALDGVYAGSLTAPASGTADVVVKASGTGSGGAAFERVGHVRATRPGPPREVSAGSGASVGRGLGGVEAEHGRGEHVRRAQGIFELLLQGVECIIHPTHLSVGTQPTVKDGQLSVVHLRREIERFAGLVKPPQPGEHDGAPADVQRFAGLFRQPPIDRLQCFVVGKGGSVRSSRPFERLPEKQGPGAGENVGEDEVAGDGAE